MPDLITIRRFKVSDIDSHYSAVQESLTELCAVMPWCHSEYSRRDSKNWVVARRRAWSQREELSFAICDKVSGEFLGNIGIHHIEPFDGCARLGYWVRTSQTGRGVASEAIQEVWRFAHKLCGLQRLEILVASYNLAGHKVAEKAGAIKEGLLRKRLIIHGTIYDATLYALSAE